MYISEQIFIKLLSYLSDHDELLLFEELFSSSYTHDTSINDVISHDTINDKLQKANDVKILMNSLKYSNVIDILKQKLTLNIIERYRDIWSHHTDIKPIPTHNKNIVFTITTCKRFNLFRKTINSFLNCCKDIHMIDRWICIDDNSSEYDRDRMRRLYPFFEFYFKTKEEKGHCKSMNMLLDMTKDYKYILHMEDDWIFFFRDSFINDAVHILESDNRYGQVLFNINYSETLNDIVNIGGGIYKEIVRDENVLRFVEHEHYSDKDELSKFQKRIGNKPHCAYWKHYSLRPSIIKRKVFDEIGEFNNETGHFEMDYSDRYYNKGYVSVFLNGGICLHTGRLTSERMDETKENAYILNNESQFVRKYTSNMKKIVINLDRRPDRWDMFKSNNRDLIFNYERYSAIDGKELRNNRYIQRLFDTNDYNYRSNMIGCALSHMKLWIDHYYNTSEPDPLIILEDDVRLSEDFEKKLDSLRSGNWDLLFLGNFLYNMYRTEQTYDKDTMPHIEKWNKKMSLSRSIGGAYGYMIKRRGIERILHYINGNGMTNCIDTMMQKSGDIVNLSYCYPHIVYSECCTNDNNVDSNIQRDFDNMNLPIETLIEMETAFLKERHGLNVSVCNKTFTTKFLDDKRNAVIVTDAINISTRFLSYNLGNPSYKTVVVLNHGVFDTNRIFIDGRFTVDDMISTR